MARELKKNEDAAVEVSNISPAAMKVILVKIKSANPGGTKGSDAFVRGGGGFSQTKDFTKFSSLEDHSPIVSIQGGGFRITADLVKDIDAGKQVL